MKFTFNTDKTHTYIEAIFEEGDTETGKREESPPTEITIKEKILTYDYPVKEIHPDILGLICMLNFYPFIGNEVEFPRPVSPRLLEAFEIPMFSKKKKINFRNVDENIPIYKGENLAISFGGGIDSTAVRTLFPSALVVHEGHLKDGKTIEYGCSLSVHDFVRSLGRNNGKVIFSNQRCASFPRGWHSWPCSMVTSLLLATDFNIGLILCGAILEGNYLWNGSRYFDRHSQQKFHGFTGNYWQSVFNTIGIPLFSPVDGLSEIGTMKLSLKALKEGNVDYGDEETKCFRRDLIRYLWDKNFKMNWESYRSEKIFNFLEKRPLYYGNIFAYAASNNIGPSWFQESISDVQKIHTDWPKKYYTRALDLCPQGWISKIAPPIIKNLELMNKEEIEEFYSWNQIENNSQR